MMVLDNSSRKLSRREESALPPPRQLAFSRRLNRNPNVAPLRFFTVENSIKSNHIKNPVGGDMVKGAARVDMVPRILGTFAEPLSQAAKSRLEALGVEVRLGHGADQIDEEGVIVAGERIARKTVIWTAGVAPSPAGKWLGAETDRAGRVRIKRDLTATCQPELFVLGRTP